MKNDVPVKNGIVIPDHELEITASRAGGPGGQHVNKTDTKITVRWNVPSTKALDDEQKLRVLKNLANRLTGEGDLIIHHGASRSQLQNKKEALAKLAHEVGRALQVPKKRKKARVSKAAQEKRLQQKARRSNIKKMRGKKIMEE